ncbi:Cation/H+ exchanger [Cynara cardunculus var. scolymus]|uniref:Cation/H+ exchanger n=1 Tax=Cynara cardunculus var. scolymus TaxID=59895 RepID=A0A103VY49_CYNCS|nr:Cation/H+ exchanger [Cynara cardunculus var. scolymus]
MLVNLRYAAAFVERDNDVVRFVVLKELQEEELHVVVGLVAHSVCGQVGPAAINIGNGLALSSTAVVLQVLQERGESTSHHGRATFSVLLFQDLAAVVLLILIPLISPNSSKGGIGFYEIAEALGLAAVSYLVNRKSLHTNVFLSFINATADYIL